MTSPRNSRENWPLTLADWYTKYMRSLSLQARALGVNHCDADDIVQQVFVNLARRTPTVAVTNPAAYLKAALRNAVNDYWRSHQRAHWVSLEDCANLPELASDEIRSDPVLVRKVGTAIEEFARAHREHWVHLERQFDDPLSSTALAVRLKKRPGAARQYISHWRGKLRAHIRQRCPGVVESYLGESDSPTTNR